MDDQTSEEQPLLTGSREPDETGQDLEQTEYQKCKQKCQHLLISKQKHYFILALVALDVSCLLADILIALIDCDSRIKNDAWVPDVREALEHAGLVFSCLFLVELLMCLWAFGLR